mmetsp:Transcript_55421/g.164760  ORF Transcript_55421/g.164760 Transcript_55421/m.164760 type:complete len:219 (+) Transcript_55421:52-708(+)
MSSSEELAKLCSTFPRLTPQLCPDNLQHKERAKGFAAVVCEHPGRPPAGPRLAVRGEHEVERKVGTLAGEEGPHVHGAKAIGIACHNSKGRCSWPCCAAVVDHHCARHCWGAPWAPPGQDEEAAQAECAHHAREALECGGPLLRDVAPKSFALREQVAPQMERCTRQECSCCRLQGERSLRHLFRLLRRLGFLTPLGLFSFLRWHVQLHGLLGLAHWS